MILNKGYVQVYTGDGKGKTTAALGLGLRAVGAGLKVYMIQFMKGGISSELKSIANIPSFEILPYGLNTFVSKNNPKTDDLYLAKKGLDYSKEIINSGKYNVVILDEINVAVNFNLVPLDDVLDIVKNKPKNLELILTGRYAPKELIDLADVVTEMKEIKHVYQKGILARKGIDY